MLYCEKCQTVSQDGQSCPLCGSQKLRPICPDDPVLLLTVGEDESSRIAAAFEEASIPCMTRPSRTGGYTSIVLGHNRCSDVRVYVPFGEVERAKDILIGIGALKTGKNTEKEERSGTKGNCSAESHGRRTAVKIFSAVLFFILIWVAVILSDRLVEALKGLFR